MFLWCEDPRPNCIVFMLQGFVQLVCDRILITDALENWLCWSWMHAPIDPCCSLYPLVYIFSCPSLWRGLHIRSSCTPGLIVHIFLFPDLLYFVCLHKVKYRKDPMTCMPCSWLFSCICPPTISVYPCRKWVIWTNQTKIFLLKPDQLYSRNSCFILACSMTCSMVKRDAWSNLFFHS